MRFLTDFYTSHKLCRLAKTAKPGDPNRRGVNYQKCEGSLKKGRKFLEKKEKFSNEIDKMKKKVMDFLSSHDYLPKGRNSHSVAQTVSVGQLVAWSVSW